MDRPQLILVVTLTVRCEAASEFERFERNAAAIMSRHGGRIERVIKLTEDGPENNTFREVHIVSFRDEASFESYRRDPELAALESLRKTAIVSTEITRGRGAPH